MAAETAEVHKMALEFSVHLLRRGVEIDVFCGGHGIKVLHRLATPWGRQTLQLRRARARARGARLPTVHHVPTAGALRAAGGGRDARVGGQRGRAGAARAACGAVCGWRRNG
jgi:hypothetical protein